jgi:hypothetical protein
MQNVQAAWHPPSTDFHIIYNLTTPPPPPSYIRHPGDVLGSYVGWASLTATSSLIKNYSITHYLYICMLFTLVTTHLHTLTYLNVFVWFLENREAPNLFIDKLNNRYPISNLYQSYRSLSIMNIGMSQKNLFKSIRFSKADNSDIFYFYYFCIKICCRSTRIMYFHLFFNI